jgi:hypothetical protein
MLGVEANDSVSVRQYQIFVGLESRVKRPPTPREINLGSPVILKAPHVAVAISAAVISLDLPLDPGQKGVDGLSRIGYLFFNSIWRSEILG